FVTSDRRHSLVILIQIRACRQNFAFFETEFYNSVVSPVPNKVFFWQRFLTCVDPIGHRDGISPSRGRISFFSFPKDSFSFLCGHALPDPMVVRQGDSPRFLLRSALINAIEGDDSQADEQRRAPHD